MFFIVGANTGSACHLVLARGDIGLEAKSKWDMGADPRKPFQEFPKPTLELWQNMKGTLGV